mgnify:CR=1 FL=1
MQILCEGGGGGRAEMKNEDTARRRKKKGRKLHKKRKNCILLGFHTARRAATLYVVEKMNRKG